MKFYSLNNIVNNVLLRRGYSIHWYMQFLVSAKDCLRQLTLDAVPIINTQLLDVVVDGGYKVVNLPCDLIDYTKVGVRVGQFVKPLLPRNSINRLHNYNDAGDIIPYDNITDVEERNNDGNIDIVSGFNSPWYSWDTVTWDTYGEFTGRFYGFSGAGSESDTFKFLPERNQIQLDENLFVDKIVLEYISDGMCCDNASKINVYTVDTIEAYILWQMKEQNRNYSSQERELAKQEYLRQYGILLARINPITIEVLRRIVNRQYKASIKT